MKYFTVTVHAGCSEAAWALAGRGQTFSIKLDFSSFLNRAPPAGRVQGFGATQAFVFAGLFLQGAAVQACTLAIANASRAASPVLPVYVHVRSTISMHPLDELLRLNLRALFPQGFSECADERCCCSFRVGGDVILPAGGTPPLDEAGGVNWAGKLLLPPQWCDTRGRVPALLHAAWAAPQPQLASPEDPPFLAGLATGASEDLKPDGGDGTTHSSRSSSSSSSEEEDAYDCEEPGGNVLRVDGGRHNLRRQRKRRGGRRRK